MSIQAKLPPLNVEPRSTFSRVAALVSTALTNLLSTTFSALGLKLVKLGYVRILAVAGENPHPADLNCNVGSVFYISAFQNHVAIGISEMVDGQTIIIYLDIDTGKYCVFDDNISFASGVHPADGGDPGNISGPQNFVITLVKLEGQIYGTFVKDLYA